MMAFSHLVIPIIITILTGISMGVWTYYDADSRNAVYAVQLAAIVAVFLPAILAYVYYRDRIGPRNRDPTPRQNIAGAIGFGGLFALLLGMYLTPPDPFTSATATGLLVPVGVGLGYIWISRIAPSVSAVG